MTVHHETIRPQKFVAIQIIYHYQGSFIILRCFKQVDSSLSFLDAFVSEALVHGAPPYKPPHMRNVTEKPTACMLTQITYIMYIILMNLWNMDTCLPVSMRTDDMYLEKSSHVCVF